MSSDYQERTSIVGYRTAFGFVGAAALIAIAFGVCFKASPAFNEKQNARLIRQVRLWAIRFEAGLFLQGRDVKSLRAGKVMARKIIVWPVFVSIGSQVLLIP